MVSLGWSTAAARANLLTYKTCQTLNESDMSLVSVLFVWVIRYDNIIKEFKQYELPDWLRDFVGILKNDLCCFDQFRNARAF